MLLILTFAILSSCKPTYKEEEIKIIDSFKFKNYDSENNGVYTISRDFEIIGRQ